MGTAWWRALGKDNWGSRPRCVLLTDGGRQEVAARLTGLVGLPDVTVSATDRWMPAGRPVRTNRGWDATASAEARIDRDDGFVAVTVRRELVTWWLEVAGSRSWTPQWDLAGTCNIEGRDGLILVEAKAHSNELSAAGKRKPRTDNGRKNHDRIGSAIAQANAGAAAGGAWTLSRDECYQLSNRFAWSWKLVSLGVPAILIYLGFLRAGEMARECAAFRTEDYWEATLRGLRSRRVRRRLLGNAH